eukprot:12927824-Prorocentrum_lima.AAC.1
MLLPGLSSIAPRRKLARCHTPMGMRKRSTCQNGNGRGHNTVGEMSEAGRDGLKNRHGQGVLGSRIRAGLEEGE